MRVIIDSRLRMRLDEVPEAMATEIRDACTHRNPQYYIQLKMGRKYTKEPEAYRVWRHTRLDDGSFELSIPRGCTDVIRSACDRYDVDYDFVDNRSTGGDLGTYVGDPWKLGGDIFPPHRMVPWDHQRKLVDAMLDWEQGLFRSPTGSGKTTAVLMAACEIQLPMIVILWETGLLKQWRERVESELGVPQSEVGLIQGGKFRLRPITLAMQQTLNGWTDAKWRRLRGMFGVVVLDEVQRYAARTYVDTLDEFDSKFRIGVSADERRKDQKHFLVKDMFGPVRHEVTKDELERAGVIHDVEVCVVPTKFTAQWYVDMLAAHDADPDENPLPGGEHMTQVLKEMSVDDERNQLALSLIARSATDEDAVLAFAHYVDHCRTIDAELSAMSIRSGLLLGGEEWRRDFDDNVAALRDGSLKVGVGTYKKMGVGLDIPRVSVGVMITPVRGKQFFDQVKGRICRTTDGKFGAKIYVLWDRAVFGDAMLHAIRKWNKTVRVWDDIDERWLDVRSYLKEIPSDRVTEKDTRLEGIIVSSGQSRAGHARRR